MIALVILLITLLTSPLLAQSMNERMEQVDQNHLDTLAVQRLPNAPQPLRVVKTSDFLPSHYNGLVWVHMDGCAPCKKMEPYVHRSIENGDPIIIIKLLDDNQSKEIEKEYHVPRCPLTIAFHNGKETNRWEGDWHDYIKTMLEWTK